MKQSTTMYYVSQSKAIAKSRDARTGVFSSYVSHSGKCIASTVLTKKEADERQHSTHHFVESQFVPTDESLNRLLNSSKTAYEAFKTTGKHAGWSRVD